MSGATEKTIGRCANWGGTSRLFGNAILPMNWQPQKLSNASQRSSLREAVVPNGTSGGLRAAGYDGKLSTIEIMPGRQAYMIGGRLSKRMIATMILIRTMTGQLLFSSRHLRLAAASSRFARPEAHYRDKCVFDVALQYVSPEGIVAPS
jgi:hypothetical protein